MKKLFLLVALAALSTGAFAQKVQWGVKAGLNLASTGSENFKSILDGEDLGVPELGEISIDAKSKMKPTFHVGVFVDIPLVHFLSFQPEIQYSRQGGYYTTKLGMAGESLDFKMWHRMNYINIPLMFKFYVIENLSVDVGPQFGFVTDNDIKVKIGGTSVSENIESDFYKSFDFTAAMGVTYRLLNKIDLTARYNLGLTNFVKDAEGDEKMEHGVIQIGVGYRF